MTVYRDPSALRPQPGLVLSLMRAPTTALQSPEENQLSEALAWLLGVIGSWHATV